MESVYCNLFPQLSTEFRASTETSHNYLIAKQFNVEISQNQNVTKNNYYLSE